MFFCPAPSFIIWMCVLLLTFSLLQNEYSDMNSKQQSRHQKGKMNFHGL